MQLIARVDEALSLSHAPHPASPRFPGRRGPVARRRIPGPADRDRRDAWKSSLYDVSAEELAADIAATDALETSGAVRHAGRTAGAGCASGRAVGRDRPVYVRGDAAACRPARPHRAGGRRRRCAVHRRHRARPAEDADPRPASADQGRPGRRCAHCRPRPISALPPRASCCACPMAGNPIRSTPSPSRNSPARAGCPACCGGTRR